MYWLMRILSFVGMLALGWAGIFIVFALGPTFHDRLGEAEFQHYTHAFTVYGPLAFLVGAFAGLGSFATQGRTRLFFLLLPVVLPVLTCIAVMVYFSVGF
ncbi:MAG: hypothetical protein JWO78_1989 [Micavibrio sp.]|nr:hypothetical protein [Micavibrio sp.]